MLLSAEPDTSRNPSPARDAASAQAFADETCVPRAHEGYEALAADPEVDVIYVGTVAQTHAACARLALAAGKPCLVEKPLTLSAAETAASRRARNAANPNLHAIAERGSPLGRQAAVYLVDERAVQRRKLLPESLPSDHACAGEHMLEPD